MSESELKSHLALASQVLEAICIEAGIDIDPAGGTALTITVGQQEARLPVGTMLAKWKEISA